jgi:hypothetical protein
MIEQSPQKRFPRWVVNVACVLLLVLVVYLVDWQFLVPLMGSQKPDPSSWLIYHLTINFGRSGPLEDWYVGYWLAALHRVVRLIAGGLLGNLVLYGLYSKIKPAS